MQHWHYKASTPWIKTDSKWTCFLFVDGFMPELIFNWSFRNTCCFSPTGETSGSSRKDFHFVPFGFLCQVAMIQLSKVSFRVCVIVHLAAWMWKVYTSLPRICCLFLDNLVLYQQRWLGTFIFSKTYGCTTLRHQTFPIHRRGTKHSFTWILPKYVTETWRLLTQDPSGPIHPSSK